MRREPPGMGILSRAVRFLPARYQRAWRSFTPNVRRYLAVAALQNVGIGVIGTAFAIHLKDRGFSESVVGDVEGALALSGAIVCLVLPPLVASVGYRRMMIASGLLLGLARFGQAFAPGALAVVALGLVYGVGDGGMQTLSTAFLSENAGPANKTSLFTADFVVRIAAVVAGSLAGGVAPVLLAPLAGEIGAYQATIVAAALLMAGSAVYAAKVEDTRRSTRGLFGAWVATLRGFRSWERVVRLLVPHVIVSTGAGLVMPFVALFLRHQVGATVTEIGVIQAVSSVAMAVAALYTPRLARRLGLVGTIVATELASLPFLVAIPFSTSLPVVASLFWIRGMLMNMSWPIYNQLSMEGLPAHDKPLVAGWVRFGWSVAWLAGSAIGGRMMAHSYTTPYFYTAALYALGALATYALLRSIRPDERPAEATA